MGEDTRIREAHWISFDGRERIKESFDVLILGWRSVFDFAIQVHWAPSMYI